MTTSKGWTKRVLSVLAAGALACAACGPRADDDTADGGNGGNDGGGGSDAAVTGDGALADAVVCDEVGFNIEALPPNLLILLDRSGSMSNDVPGTGLNRWEVARAAIIQVTGTFQSMIRFGLATYSSCLPGGCSAGAVRVPIAIDNAGAIDTFLSSTAGEGSSNGALLNGQGLIQYLCDSGDPETSTGASLQALVGEPTLASTDRENAVLLVTDGEESGSCVVGGNDGPTAAGHLLAQNPPVSTYAVGFVGANVTELQNVATAGGTGQPYFADDPAELELALQTIAGAIVSCTYALPGLDPTADTNQVNFYFDGAVVPYNDGCAGGGGGWTWTDASHTQVEFCGPSCVQLTGHQISDVSATFGCQTVVN
ncbi:MAG: hypothetical protein ABI333_25295 [bacterium]